MISQISCSSSPELNGEVFVITKGTGKYKLGGVDVLAISEKEFTEFSASKKAEKELLLKNLETKIAECETIGSGRNDAPGHERCLLELEDAKAKIGDIYLAGLPDSSASAKTNNEGKFTLRLPDKGRYIIVAKASRNAGGVIEQYHWFIPFDANDAQQNFVISNKNLYQPDKSPF